MLIRYYFLFKQHIAIYESNIIQHNSSKLYTYTGESYLFEIISGLIPEEDITYFKFVELFDKYVSNINKNANEC